MNKNANETPTLKMLWIDDSVNTMDGLDKGFISRTALRAEIGKAKSIEHCWWRLGDNESEDESNNTVKKKDYKYLVLLDNMDNNTNFDHVKEKTKQIKSQFNIFAVDLLLKKNDINTLQNNVSNPKPILSMELYNDLSNEGKKCILYSLYALNGNIGEIWKNIYGKIYPESKNTIENVEIYNLHAILPSSFNAWYADKIIDYITKE